MKSKSNIAIFAMMLCGVIFFLGCGGDSIENLLNPVDTSTPTTTEVKTSLSGTLTLPEVSSGILADIAYSNHASTFNKIASSGKILVNGKSYPFSLNKTTRLLHIKDIDKASFYDMKFILGSFQIRAMAPHTGTIISKPFNLNSTAEAFIFEKYNFTATQMQNFPIKQEIVDGLATKFLNKLAEPASAPSAFTSFLSSELTTLSTTKTFSDLTTNLTPAVDLSGTWKGSNITYYGLNLFGEKAYKVTASVVMTLVQKGNVVTGVFDITPTKQEKLTTSSGIGAPETFRNITVNGTLSSTNFAFNTGSFTSGGIKEKWTFTVTSNTMAGEVANQDTNSFLGLQSDAKAFVLAKS